MPITAQRQQRTSAHCVPEITPLSWLTRATCFTELFLTSWPKEETSRGVTALVESPFTEKSSLMKTWNCNTTNVACWAWQTLDQTQMDLSFSSLLSSAHGWTEITVFSVRWFPEMILLDRLRPAQADLVAPTANTRSPIAAKLRTLPSERYAFI